MSMSVIFGATLLCIAIAALLVINGTLQGQVAALNEELAKMRQLTPHRDALGKFRRREL